MKASLRKRLNKAVKGPFPEHLSPMLCTLARQVITGSDFIHELKFDGYRIIAYVRKGRIRLDSRSGLNYSSRYPSVISALEKLKLDIVLDGEICALNSEGNPDFDLLQKPSSSTALIYYVFDLLWFDGYDTMQLHLLERKNLLKEALKDNQIIRYAEHFEDGHTLFNEVKSLGIEGIVSKRKTSLYNPGERGSNWYKTPTEKRQEYVIGGWVESSRNRAFATLLFGAYDGKKLQWIGHAGLGFKDREMPVILDRLKAIETKKKPFINEVDYDGKVHWVKPKLVANIKFATFTKSGRIRKPAIFLGFREDKKATDVVQEIPVDMPDGNAKSNSNHTKRKLPPASAESNWREVEKQKLHEVETISIGECDFEASDIDRQVWKGITKMELIQYYHSVSKWLLPHVKNRPQSLHLKLINANAPGLYVKDMEGRQPECADIFVDKRKHKKAGKRDIIEYLVCNNEATLLYMINLGCVDINPWTSKIDSPEQPDYIVIDLDPSDEDFNKATESALAAKEFLNAYKIRSFVKTSGKTGIHIYLPCRGFDFAQARSIAENICDGIHELVPDITTTNVSVNSRGNKLYLDPNQNDYADTLAAPYSARPFSLPTVSTPLDWKEIKPGLDSRDFTIKTILKRVQRKGDIFSSVLDKKIAQSNTPQLKRLLNL